MRNKADLHPSATALLGEIQRALREVQVAQIRPAAEENERIAARADGRGGAFGGNVGPGARAVRKQCRNLFSPAADLAQRRGALLPTLETKKDKDLFTCRACWFHRLAREGRSPRCAGHSHTDGRNFA